MDHIVSMPNAPKGPEGFGVGSNISVKQDSIRRVSLEEVISKKATQRYTHVRDLLKVQKYLGSDEICVLITQTYYLLLQ